MSTQTKVTEKKPTPLTYVKKAIKIFINCNLRKNSKQASISRVIYNTSGIMLEFFMIFVVEFVQFHNR